MAVSLAESVVAALALDFGATDFLPGTGMGSGVISDSGVSKDGAAFFVLGERPAVIAALISAWRSSRLSVVAEERRRSRP